MSGFLIQGAVTPDDSVSTVKVKNDAVTLAKMAGGTDGNIISYDASGNPVAVVTGSSGQVLTSAGAGAPPTFAATGLVLGTEQATTSGTSKTFGSIPSGTKRITINFVDVSSNGTTPFIVQIGDAGGIETTGYSSSACRVKATPVMHAVVTACFLLADSITAGEGYHGRVTLELEDSSAFTWTSTGALTGDIDPAASGLIFSMGSKSLSAELTQVLIQLENGSDAFDAGAINIIYE